MRRTADRNSHEMTHDPPARGGPYAVMLLTSAQERADARPLRRSHRCGWCPTSTSGPGVPTIVAGGPAHRRHCLS